MEKYRVLKSEADITEVCLPVFKLFKLAVSFSRENQCTAHCLYGPENLNSADDYDITARIEEIGGSSLFIGTDWCVRMIDVIGARQSTVPVAVGGA